MFVGRVETWARTFSVGSGLNLTTFADKGAGATVFRCTWLPLDRFVVVLLTALPSNFVGPLSSIAVVLELEQDVVSSMSLLSFSLRSFLRLIFVSFRFFSSTCGFTSFLFCSISCNSFCRLALFVCWSTSIFFWRSSIVATRVVSGCSLVLIVEVEELPQEVTLTTLYQMYTEHNKLI